MQAGTDTSGWSKDPRAPIAVYRPPCTRAGCRQPCMRWGRCSCGVVFGGCVEDKLETLRRWEIEHPAGVSVAWDRRYNAADLDGWRPACRTSDWGTVRSIAAAFADRGGR